MEINDLNEKEEYPFDVQQESMSIQLLQATEVVFKPHTFIYLISISS
jgi:hypothetical protein